VHLGMSSLRQASVHLGMSSLRQAHEQDLCRV
jgi:hypothetical protein